MNEELHSADCRAYCTSLWALQKEGEWNGWFDTFEDYCAKRWSLSRARTKLLIKFAKFCKACDDEALSSPDTPENVKPLLSLPQKQWADVWRLCLDCSEGEPINAAHVQGVMERFGIIARKRIPQDVLDGIRARKAVNTLAGFEDGEKLVERIGKNGLGNRFSDAVTVMIDADQAARS